MPNLPSIDPLKDALSHHTDEKRISGYIRKAVNGFCAAVSSIFSSHTRLEISKSLNQTATKKTLVKEMQKAQQKAMPFTLFAKTAAAIAQNPKMEKDEKQDRIKELRDETKRLSEMDKLGNINRPGR